MAACLRDHKRAVLIGESSWGKGTVQNVIPIQLHKSALKLTTASYWPPNGENFDRKYMNKTPEIYGVHPEPDMTVEMTEEEVLENRIQRNKRDLETLLGNNTKQNDAQQTEPPTAETTSPESEASEDSGEDKPVVDRPLQRAIQYFEEVFGKKIGEVATSAE